MHRTIALLLLFSCLLTALASCAGAKSRKQARRQAACTEMAEMKENGVLVVRLRTYNNRLKKLRQDLAGATVKPKAAEALSREIAVLEHFRDSTHRSIQQAFQTYYSYTSVVFMADTSSARLFKNEPKGYFLGPDLRPDTSISIGGKKVYLFDYELTTMNQSDLVGIGTLDGKPFEAPFSYLGRGGVQREFQQGTHNYPRIIRRFNELFLEMEMRCKMNLYLK
jgi:hypothetical protein